jgi:hypothetical protein
MPDDGLSTGWNMQHKCKGTICIKTNICHVRLSKCSLFDHLSHGMIYYAYECTHVVLALMEDDKNLG